MVLFKLEPHRTLYYSRLPLRRTPLGPAVSERCPSYRESNKGSKERQGPTMCPFYRGVR